LEVTIHFRLSAFANVLATSTLSTVHFTSRAKGGVGEFDSQSAPDRSVFEVGLVAGFDLSSFAVRRNSDGLDLRGLRVEFSGHGTVEASSLQGFHGCGCGRSGPEGTVTNVELKEVSALVHVESDSEELGNTTVSFC